MKNEKIIKEIKEKYEELKKNNNLCDWYYEIEEILEKNNIIERQIGYIVREIEIDLINSESEDFLDSICTFISKLNLRHKVDSIYSSNEYMGTFYNYIACEQQIITVEAENKEKAKELFKKEIERRVGDKYLEEELQTLTKVGIQKL